MLSSGCVSFQPEAAMMSADNRSQDAQHPPRLGAAPASLRQASVFRCRRVSGVPDGISGDERAVCTATESPSLRRFYCLPSSSLHIVCATLCTPTVPNGPLSFLCSLHSLSTDVRVCGARATLSRATLPVLEEGTHFSGRPTLSSPSLSFFVFLLIRSTKIPAGRGCVGL